MKGNIKFEKFSSEIRKEIESFRSDAQKKGEEKSLEEAMVQWFDSSFDQWVIKRFNLEPVNNKRRHFRLNVEIPIRIIETLIESSHEDKEAHDLVGNIINISKGGLYFKYRWPIEISSIIKVQIDLPSIDKDLDRIEALAMVVRMDKVSRDEYGIGVMFSSIYDSDKFNLDLFILNNLSYHLYTGQ
ncbi:MAG TPA: PilZ domain-containing protein [Spirochaetota bacterium]|nr:PilZ domain-containing protein [Spirochaetota bacterium]HPI90819.1 PilZ domain-containing protein [Spirochaetota bacterium]HPR47641.1 PilZ domain-containing protein [Spirochaetota bacterium]